MASLLVFVLIVALRVALLRGLSLSASPVRIKKSAVAATISHLPSCAVGVDSGRGTMGSFTGAVSFCTERALAWRDVRWLLL